MRLGCTVAELGRRMSAAEFLEWEAFDKIHVSESWYQAAQSNLVASRIAGASRVALEDFLPERRKVERPAPTPAELAAKLRAIAEAHNARVTRQGAGPVAFR